MKLTTDFKEKLNYVVFYYLYYQHNLADFISHRLWLHSEKVCWLCWCDDENNNKYESKIIKLSKAVNCIDDIFLSGIIITDLVFICFIGCVIYSSNISGGKMELESSDKITPISSTSYYLEDDKYYYFNTSDETIEVPKNSVKMNIKYVESENARIEKYSTHIDENSVNPVFYISWVNDDKTIYNIYIPNNAKANDVEE